MMKVLFALSFVSIFLVQAFAVPLQQGFNGQVSAGGCTKVGSISVQNPAFVKWSADQADSLFVTTFNPSPFNSKMLLSQVTLGKSVGDEAKGVKTLSDGQMDWPNEPHVDPQDSLGLGFPSVIVGAGFLVPGHEKGAVWAVPLGKEGSIVQLTPNFDGKWFFHRTFFVDLDGDGHLDVLTARATKGLLTNGGELVWLRNPGPSTAGKGAWQMQTITEGPDFLFDYADVDGDGVKEVISCPYFGGQVTVYWLDGVKVTASRIIDESFKHGFDAHAVHLRGDGSMQIVATDHVSTGAVFGYSWPNGQPLKDSSTPITKEVIASGYTIRGAWKPGQAAPGEAVAFWDSAACVSTQGGAGCGAPSFMVAGDGNNTVSVARPADKSGLQYSTSVLEDTHATIGGITQVIFEDGTLGLIAAVYEKNRLDVFQC